MTNSTDKFDLRTPSWAGEENGLRAWFTRKNVADELEQRIPGLNLGMSTGEDQEVVKRNRRRLFRKLDIDPNWVAMGSQVHSSKVQMVTSGGLYGETDGLVTTIPGLTLVIQTADCAAVLLADPENRVVGAVHAGWRGAVGGIVHEGIQRMKEVGADPATMYAYISPCISQRHFEVGPEVSELFPEDFVDSESYSKPHVDIKGFLREELEQHGLNTSRIDVDNDCTFDDEQHYYSYRREGDESGRMFGLIQLRYH